MSETFEIPELFAKLADPNARDEVVAAYKAAGLGGERYGVVCPIWLDEERTTRCNKRICPQGWAFATSIENSGKYCMHRENYDGEEPAEDITSILAHHGLPFRRLRTLTRMRENKPNKKKGSKKNGTQGQGSQERSSDDAEAGRGSTHPADSVRGSGGYGSTEGEVRGKGGSESALAPDGTTFGQYLDGKLPPRNGSTRGPRLFRRDPEEDTEVHGPSA